MPDRHATRIAALLAALAPTAHRLRDNISKALPADRGPLAATKDARRAVQAALSAQRSQYGPPTGRRDR